MICFYSGRDLCVETFCNEVVAQFDSASFTRSIVFITPEFNKSDIKRKLLNDKAQSLIKDRINSLQELIFHTCFISRKGKFKLNTLNSSDTTTLTTQDIDKLLEIGLFNIITNRSLIIEAHSNIHFVKPSGKHSAKFIDVKNILESSPEISFIATNLLKLLPEKVNKIYIDTSGIYSLAFELSNLIKAFDPNAEVISIDSFSSYDGFGQYKFNSDSGTVILISASTSNNLYENLKKELITPELVSFITIIMTQKNDGTQQVLIEFEKYRRNYCKKYFENFMSYSEDKCPMCSEQSSIPIVLDKSRFHFALPRTESYLPKHNDSDGNLRNLIRKYKELDAFRCHFDGVDGKKPRTPEYFIDVSKIITENAFNEELQKFINKSFPLNTSCIIYCKDQGAKELAQLIKQSVARLNLEVDLYGADEIPSEIQKGIMVVAGSLESGKALLNISRALRKHHGLPITYIIGFAKYNSESEFDTLKKDLRFSAGAIGHHEVRVIEKILLPINENKTSTWEKEILFLTEILPQYKHDSTLKVAIENRIQLLREASSLEIKGLGKSLFINTHSSKPFILGKSFAFWDETDNGKEFRHQATVYFTISSILQRLRTTDKNGIKPLGDGYIIRQLDPLLFDRFNEGIIQASVLRAAKSRELDYSSNDRQSQTVGTLIERMLKFPDTEESSGLAEFLLALCLKKLQIKKDHLPDFDNIPLDKEAYPMAYIFARHAKNLLLENSIIEDSTNDTNVAF